jgi:hypothetical protein
VCFSLLRSAFLGSGYFWFIIFELQIYLRKPWFDHHTYSKPSLFPMSFIISLYFLQKLSWLFTFYHLYSPPFLLEHTPLKAVVLCVLFNTDFSFPRLVDFSRSSTTICWVNECMNDSRVPGSLKRKFAQLKAERDKDWWWHHISSVTSWMLSFLGSCLAPLFHFRERASAEKRD